MSNANFVHESVQPPYLVGQYTSLSALALRLGGGLEKIRHVQTQRLLILMLACVAFDFYRL